MAGYRDVIDGLNGLGDGAAARAAAVLGALEQRGHPEEDVASFLDAYREILSEGSERSSVRGLSRLTTSLLGHLEKRHKLVVPGHYRNQWMALGMAVFGIPLGAALGLSLDNMAFLGIGLPIGLSIGLGVGSSMDQKAQQEGRQLPVGEQAD